MLESMACQSGMVGFDVHLEVLVQVVVTQEADGSGSIKVVLVLHRLLGLGLDVEITGKADGAAILNGHLHQGSDILLLELHIGVQQSLIAFTAAPEHVTLAAQLDGDIQCLLDLCSCEAENISGIRGTCAIHETGIAEHIGSAPQALDAGFLHFLQNVIGDLIQTAVGFLDVSSLRNDIHIMEAEVLNTQLLHELEACIHLCLCMLHGAGNSAKGLVGSLTAEHISAAGAEVMPPCHCERQMLLHGLAHDDLLRIIELKCQRIIGCGTFIRNHRNVGKIHNNTSNY